MQSSAPKAYPGAALFHAGIFSSLLMGCLSCSKLDIESNCLNEKVGCFKPDKTAPQFAKAIEPTAGQIVSVLSYIDLRFSEELNNPQASDFQLLDAGAAALIIHSVTQIDSFTYRLNLSGSVQTGPIRVRFANVRDYGRNLLTGVDEVQFIGNVDAIITFDFTAATNPGYRPAVSNWATGGHRTTTIKWYHDIASHADTRWQTFVTTGAINCPVTLSNSTAANGAANTQTQVFDRLTDFNTIPGAGNYRVVVCVRNDTLNKKGAGSAFIVRDDTPPVVSHLPLDAEYSSAKDITITCTSNPDKIYYSHTNFPAWAGNLGDPADPADPYNSATGALTGGTPYTTPLTTPNTTNPTRSKYRYGCFDTAGNWSAVSGTSQATYVIDTTLPEVTVVANAGYHDFVSTSGYATTTLVFTTNQTGTQYRIVRGATTCLAGDGTSLIGGTQTTPTAGTSIQHTIPASAFSTASNGLNNVHICVANAAVSKWGAATLQIVRDDDAPTATTASVGTGSYGSAQSVVLTCNDANPHKIAYTTDGTAPSFFANGEVNTSFSHTTPYMTPEGVTTLRYLCRDKAGNEEFPGGSQTYTIDSILPTVTVISTQYSAISNTGNQTSTQISWRSSRASRPYSFRVGGTNCLTATPLTPAGTYTGTTPADTNTTTSTVLSASEIPGGDGDYIIRICVTNTIGEFGSASFTIKKDSTPPSTPSAPNNVPAVTYVDALNFSLNWNAATDAGSGVAGYRIYHSIISNDYAAVYPNSPLVTVTSLPATITLPTTSNYFIRVVPIDAAGNITALAGAYAQVPTQGNITINVNSPGSSSTFTFSDGAATNPVNAAIGISTIPWTTSLIVGGTYNFSISNPPAGKVCAIHEKQFGTLTGNLSIHVSCVDGYMVGQNVNAVPGTKLSYRLFQGKNTAIAGSGSIGAANGNGAAASFQYPEYITHLAGAIYVSDSNNYKIRKVLTNGDVTDVTGTGSNGSGTTGDDGPCATAALGQPMGISTDGTNLYLAEFNYGRIRKISDVNGTCTVTTLVGAQASAFADGTASAARFNQMRQIVANNTHLFVADSINGRIRRVSLASGDVDTLVSGLTAPAGLSLIGTTLYTSTGDNRIFSLGVTPGTATVVAGDGNSGSTDATALVSRFNGIYAMTTDGVDLYIADTISHLIRRVEVSQSFRTTTIAGAPGQPGGDTIATGIEARFNIPHGIATDGRSLFVANHTGHTIRKITDNGLVGFWPLNGDLNDHSSDGSAVKTGTIEGNVTTTQGRFGAGSTTYYFDGVNDAVRTSAGAMDTNFNTGDFSIAFWVKPAAIQAENDGPARDYDIISNWSSQYDFAIRYHNEISSVDTIPQHTPGQIIFIRFDGTNVAHCISGMRIDDGKFHHVAAQKSGNNLYMFIDGKKVCTANDSNVTLPITNVGPVKIGMRPGGTTNDFTGAISEMRIYKRALNEGEIHELAQDASSSTAITGPGFSTGATGLLTHYEFTGGTAGNANLSPSGPLGGTFGGSASSPTGKDGESSGSAYFIGSAALSFATTGLPTGNAPRTMCVFYLPHSIPPADGIRYLVSYGANGNDNQFGVGIARLSGVDYIDNIWNSAAINLDHIRPYTSHLYTWQHLCAVYDGSASHLYLNGKSMGSQTHNLTTSDGQGRVGSNYNDSQHFIGNIDDVRIYNNALTAMQIRQLSTQVPIGLLARYDFTGDRSDASGWGNTLSNSGATLGSDRFGAANSAAVFTANAYLDGTMTNFPLAATPRTLCVWTNPSVLYPALFSEVVMYGTSAASAGWGFGMDARLPNNGAMYLLDTAGDQIYSQPHGLNIWRHLCATYDGTTERLYVDGTAILAKNLTLATASGVLAIGRGIWAASGNFNGSLDDVRVYNRILSTAEMQALQLQANKKIYSTTAYQGNIGGLTGADTTCNTDGNKPVGGGTYKAMLVDATPTRRACTSANCASGSITENVDWVLRPNTTYILGTNVAVFTANFNSIWDFTGGNFTNPIGGSYTWTSLNADWTSRTGETCGNWTTNSVGVNASDGNGTAIGSTAILSGTAIHCGNNRNLYCVQQ